MSAIETASKGLVKKERSLTRIFFWPLLIGVLSGIGLIGALLEDGWWDSLFCAALAIPVFTAAVFGWWRN